MELIDGKKISEQIKLEIAAEVAKIVAAGGKKPHLAAVLGGATHVNTTVNGLGERTGNAPLEEVVMALQQLYGIDAGVSTRRLAGMSQVVAQAAGRPVAANKPIVGSGVFTHESGVHVSGLLRDPANYQSIDPRELGRDHQLVLGKHSGTASVRWAYRQLDIALDEGQAKLVLPLLREHAARTKRQPSADELLEFLGNTAAPPAARSRAAACCELV